jgi:hypothetical protein
MRQRASASKRMLSGQCRGFVWWLSTHSAARQARRQQARQATVVQRLPSRLQCSYLQTLGDDGPVPANMPEASERIAALVRGEV